MKKLLLLTAVLLCAVSATFAADHRVRVADFQFSPKTINAVVGDTVSWQWQTGAMNHTTTSVLIPAGAAAWDAPLNAATPRFRYTITVPGTYRYQCSFHSSVMKGTIRVTGGQGAAQQH